MLMKKLEVPFDPHAKVYIIPKGELTVGLEEAEVVGYRFWDGKILSIQTKLKDAKILDADPSQVFGDKEDAIKTMQRRVSKVVHKLETELEKSKEALSKLEDEINGSSLPPE